MDLCAAEDRQLGAEDLGWGTGTAGFSGDGGPATSAEVFHPEGVALDAAGDLLITDNLRIRLITG